MTFKFTTFNLFNKLPFNNLTNLTHLIVFHTNIIAYCQQNWYVQLAIYTDLFTLNIFEFSWGVRKCRILIGLCK